MKRILVTGGAGFIGSHLAFALQRKFSDAYIAVMDDFSSGTFKNLRGFKGDVITTDLLNIPNDCVLNFDYVFHMASISDTRVTDEGLVCQKNIEGFRALLSRIFGANERARVIYASSASVYGLSPDDIPFVEAREHAPENVYAFSKCQLENLASILVENAGVNITGVRFFNVYGYNETHKDDYASMIRQLTIQAKTKGSIELFEDGSQRRDFVHVYDVVEMLIKLMDYNGAQHIFNCGSGEATSFNVIAALVEEKFAIWLAKKQPESRRDIMAWGRELLHREYKKCPYPFFQSYTCADMTLAKNELDFTPQYSNIEGIRNYISSIYAS